MSIISIQDLEKYIPKTIAGTSSKDKYDFLILAVQELAEKLTNRQFDKADYDEVYDMDGSEINLNQYPVNSITTVEYGSPFGDVDRTELETTEYIRYDMIGNIKLNIVARRAPQYARVVYSAGWSEADPSVSSDAPNDLKLILMEEVQNQFVTVYSSSLVKSDRGGDYKIEFFSNSDIGNTSIFAKKLSKYIRSSF